MWANFLKWTEKIFKPCEITDLLKQASLTEKIKTNKKITYYNYACSFDIETTSAYNDNGEKIAFMYLWTLGINGLVCIGRTWQEFINVYNEIVEFFNLSNENRLIIYVQNLGFEFQFFRRIFKWEKVFAVKERRPVYALTDNGVEFRCSFILSGYNLAKIGENLQKYKVNKMCGDLDYKLIRHSETPLTATEMSYCINDVAVVMCYIQETIENDGNITKIPLTKTGYVRNYCRKNCLSPKNKKDTKKFHTYHNLMQILSITPNEYRELKQGFQGGFTHANAHYSGKTLTNVASYDFTSSYPAVMIAEKFPMSRGKEVKITSEEDFKKYLRLYCCLFVAVFDEIYSTTGYENYISTSRCRDKQAVIENNGRIVEANKITITLTEQDYFIIENSYKWKRVKIYNFIVYKKDYLPTDFIKSIITLYGDKTKLKDVQGKETEYLKSKEMINSCYGMTVTDICRDDITYNSEWGVSSPDYEKTIIHYNKSKRRFLFFPWGVWITAYARRNLFTGINEFKNDYVYSDTDSLKVLNYEKHVDYINRYNAEIQHKLELAADFHKIDKNLLCPKTIKGIEKPLGVWDFEGVYDKFKTLGAKRYMTEKNNELSLTVSGVNKKIAVPYLINKYKNNVFKAFSEGLYIPQNATGKNTHTYIDERQSGVIVDYLGQSSIYDSESGIHLEGADYTLSLSSAYLDFISGVQQIDE